MSTGIYQRKSWHNQKIREGVKRAYIEGRKISWNKGKKFGPLSDIVKQKIGLGNKGKKVSLEAREKMSIARHKRMLRVGYLLSPEIRKRYSIAMTGKNNRMYGIRIRGKDHYNWKGGISSLSSGIKSLEEYSQWRLGIFKRDFYSCVKCGYKGKDIEAHHTVKFAILFHEFLSKYNQFSPLEEKEILIRLAIKHEPFWDINNGETLCVSCHARMRKVNAGT